MEFVTLYVLPFLYYKVQNIFKYLLLLANLANFSWLGNFCLNKLFWQFCFYDSYTHFCLPLTVLNIEYMETLQLEFCVFWWFGHPRNLHLAQFCYVQSSKLLIWTLLRTPNWQFYPFLQILNSVLSKCYHTYWNIWKILLTF